jgi:hypothetical protein
LRELGLAYRSRVSIFSRPWAMVNSDIDSARRRKRVGRCIFIDVWYTSRLCVYIFTASLKEGLTYFSSSFSFVTSNDSSQPTSIKTLTPPSSSSSDCDADDLDCAPCREQNVNILGSTTSLSTAPLPLWHHLIACPRRRYMSEGFTMRCM